VNPARSAQPSEITIRRSRPDDAAAIAAYMADPAVFAQVLQLPHPSEAMWRERLSTPAVPGSMDISLVAELGGQVVASAGLFGSSPLLRRRHAISLGIAVAVPAQGKGVGDALMAALTDYADNWTTLQRIELTVFADNARAIALYQRHGFVEEGRLRGYAIRHGEYADCLSMARWRPEPMAHPQ
jgi:L-phenylalanine/L-methionine N-acetyltransferase